MTYKQGKAVNASAQNPCVLLLRKYSFMKPAVPVLRTYSDTSGALHQESYTNSHDWA